MKHRECPYCHENVSFFGYWTHRIRHTSLLADGQMSDHITLNHEGRYEGSLDGVPTVYVHARCGGMTEMPEEIIRSYLVNAALYNNDSFCSGCGKYINTKQLTWADTGESLFDYNRRLRAAQISARQDQR